MTAFTHEWYETQAVLGEGATAVVWRVLDRRSGTVLALKVLTPDAAASAPIRLAFRAEYQAMRRLAHPRLVRAHEFGTLADGRLYFTLDLVAGPALAALAPLASARARALLVDALEGLAAMHARGVLHGDLKPENLRLDAEGRLTILDFGLATRLGEHAPGVQGTPRYLAPEVVRGERLDGRADLYALGAVFYHVLAGRPPFQGEEARGLLEAILTAPLEPLAAVAPDVDPALAATIMALLARSRHDRPAGALELLEALGAAPAGLGAALPAPAFVGRAHELAWARAAFAAAPAARAVTAPAGGGKTRFLEEVLAAAQLEGHATWSGSATGAPDRAYGSLEAFAAWVADRAEHHQPGATARFVTARTQAAALTPRAARATLQAAWTEALEATGRRPIVAAFDDWDRADGPSRELLAALAAHRGGPLVAFTASEGGGDLPLPPLTAEEVGALVGSQLGTEPPARLAAALRRLTDGLPGLARATLDHLVAGGDLPREGGRWRPDRVAVEALALPPDAVAGAAHVGDLPADARTLASALALAERPITVTEAGAWLGIAEDALAEAVETLAERGLLVDVATRPRLASPALAAALADQVHDPEAARIHAALARGLTDLGDPADAPARAWHLFGAGDDARASGEAIAGARVRLAALDLDEATRLLANALVRSSEPVVLAEAFELMGDIARIEGKTEDALAAYEKALATSTDDRGRARLEVSAALALQLSGKHEAATARATVGAAAAETAGAPAEAARAHTTLARLHHFAGRPAEAAAACEAALTAARAAGELELEAEALGLLGFLRVREPGRMAEGLAMLERSLAIREARGDRLALVDAHLTLGNALVAAGRYPAAADAFARALALGRAHGGAGDDEITTLINVGQVATELGRLDEARDALDQAVRLATELDNPFLAAYARGLRGRALASVGRVADAVMDAEAALRQAEAIGSTYLEASTRAWQAAVLLAAGDAAGALDTAHEGRALARPLGDPELDTALALACADALIALGSPSVAPRHLAGLSREAPSIAARAGLVEARAALALGELPRAREAADVARRAADEAGLVPLMLELALVDGARAIAEGRPREAASQLRQAHDHALDHGLVLVAADAARLLAEVETDPAAQRLASAARAGLASAVDALPAGLRAPFAARWLAHEPLAHAPAAQAVSADAEALSVISDFGRMVTGTLRYDEVLDRVIDRVMALAGAERGMVMLVEPDGGLSGVVTRPRDAAGEAGLMAFSSTFVKTALESRESLWIADAQSDARFAAAASVMALDLRTVLCVPLQAEGEVTGLLYVDRRSVNRTFSEADLRLVEGLAGFAALAIANARRYEETRQHAAELAAAQTLGRLAGGQRGFEEVLATILRAVGSVLPAERFVLLLGDDPWPTIATDAAGAPAEADVAQAIIDEVAGAREGLIDRDPHDAVARAPRQVMAAPMVMDDDLLGALYLVRSEDARPFTPRELELLETLADHAAPALDAVATRTGLQRNVERLEGLAQGLQARLLLADDDDI